MRENQRWRRTSKTWSKGRKLTIAFYIHKTNYCRDSDTNILLIVLIKNAVT